MATIAVQSDDGHWGKGPSLEEAVKNLQEAGGLHRKVRVHVRMYTADPKDVRFGDEGWEYPSGTQGYRIGYVELSRQPKD